VEPTTKLSIASLGAEPGPRYLDQVKLAERLGFHAFFHNDKKWARNLFARLAFLAPRATGLGLAGARSGTKLPLASL